MVKGKETIYALKNLNFDYFKYNAWWNSRKDGHAIGLPAVFLNGIFHVVLSGTGKYSLHLLPDIIASRFPLVLLGSLTSPLIFWFTSNYVNRRVAALAAITYALNPITIALDRWILHDSPKTIFSFLAVATYLIALARKKISIWPGIWLTLGFLSKPTVLIGGVVWFFTYIKSKTNFTFKLFLTNIISFILSVLVLWPQSWFYPILAIPEYLVRQAVLTKTGDPLPNFYLGQATFYPDWTYYIFQFLTRTPEIILIFFLIAATIFIRKKPKMVSTLSIIIFCFLIFTVYSLTPQKGGIRYALPIFPWLYIASAWGFFQITVFIRNNYLNFALLIAYIFFSVYPLIYFPNLYLYYNRFIGGPVSAQKIDLVGLCFGTKPALEYLDQNNITGLVAVVGCADTAPYHTPRTLTKDWNQADMVILESSYKQQHPDYDSVKNTEARMLLKDIYQHGVLTAKIYR